MNRLTLISATALLLSGMASASTLTVNCNTIGPNPTELSGSISCPQFSLAGQTLNNVMITVSGTINGAITLTNNASTNQTVSGTTTSQFNVGSMAGFAFSNPLFTATFGTGVLTITPGQTITSTGLTGSGSGSLGTATTSLGGYIGIGNFLIPVSTLSGFSVLGGGGQIGSSQATQARATAQVIYDYSPTGGVPEPSTTFTMAAGLVAVAFGVRKRFANR